MRKQEQGKTGAAVETGSQPFKGMAASKGIAIGPVKQYSSALPPIRRQAVADPTAEWQRFQAACQAAEEQLQSIREEAAESLGAEEAEIFEAHKMMLLDPGLQAAVQQAIEEDQDNAEYALQRAAEDFAQALAALPDETLRERAADLRDVAARVTRLLLGLESQPAEALQAPAIVVAEDLTPSDTVQLDKSLVLGFATAQGGPTSHSAILARQLGIPAVVGLGPEILEIEGGAGAILDGTRGELLVKPSDRVLQRYEEAQGAQSRQMAEAKAGAQGPARGRDGQRIQVAANIGHPEEASLAQEYGAEGIGLFRSEFLFFDRQSAPGEEEQLEAYRQVLQAFPEQPVVLRTVDIGGDKELPYLEQAKEENPFLGQRGLRLCLARPELFKPQLRAALRAAPAGQLHLMFPMVSALDEVRQAKAMVAQCRRELEEAGEAIGEMQLGIMVETPAAALLADKLAAEVDFFSIGTNDLSQYTLAADRTNARVAPLSAGLQPAVMKLIAMVCAAAQAQSKWVGVCGELAAQEEAIPILVGLGVEELSMNALSIPAAKAIIRGLDSQEARQLAQAALACSSSDEILDLSG